MKKYIFLLHFIRNFYAVAKDVVEKNNNLTNKKKFNNSNKHNKIMIKNTWKCRIAGELP